MASRCRASSTSAWQRAAVPRVADASSVHAIWDNSSARPGYMSPEQADPNSPGHRHAHRCVLAGSGSLCAARRDSAVRDEPPAAAAARRTVAQAARGRAAHGRAPRSKRIGIPLPPPLQARGTEPRQLTQTAARRSRLDRDEGAGQGSQPPLRRAIRAGCRSSALPEQRAGRGASAKSGLPGRQVRQAP